MWYEETCIVDIIDRMNRKMKLLLFINSTYCIDRESVFRDDVKYKHVPTKEYISYITVEYVGRP